MPTSVHIYADVCRFVISCNAMQRRAEGWDNSYKFEYDNEGNIIEYEYMDNVLVGDDFESDSKWIRWAAAVYR